MIYKWPDISDLGVDLYLNKDSDEVPNIVVVSNKSDDLLDFYQRELLAADFVEGRLDDKRCFFKKTDTFTVNDLSSMFPSFNQHVSLRDISSIDEISLEGQILYSENNSPKDTSKSTSSTIMTEFNNFMLSEYVPATIREKHLESIKALIEIIPPHELTENLYAVEDVKKEFLEEQGNPEFVKRKRIECSYPFFLEFLRRKNLGLNIRDDVESQSVDDFYHWLCGKAEEAADKYRDRNVFLNLFDRNMHICGAKFMVDFVLADKQGKKEMSQLIKNTVGSDVNGVDLRFALLRDKQKIHFKSPVITYFDKKMDLDLAANEQSFLLELREEVHKISKSDNSELTPK